jgi:NAD(P)-dependent dehydrogenase (short-subunit alcohol dehydrogenase family)
MAQVAGRTAFITGGGNGIGLGLARTLLDLGCRVAIADIRADDLRRAQELCAEHADNLMTIELDVSDREAMLAAADAVEDRFGNVHLLFNNAAINSFGPMDEASFDDWDWIMGVNVQGVINGLVAFLPKLKKHGEGGYIVNTASMAAFVPGPGAGIYTASKFCVRGISECLWYHVGPQGIGVAILCPGLVNSNIHRSEEIRPQTLSEHGYPVNDEFMKALETVHELGMDPMEVARRTVAAIERNAFYIFTHPDHREELEQLHEAVMAEIPDEEPEPERFAYELKRRAGIADARARAHKALGIS